MAEPVVTLHGTQAIAVTKSDATEYYPPITLYVGGTGNVAVVDALGGASVIFTAVPAGTVLPVRVRQVLSTGTTATALVGVRP